MIEGSMGFVVRHRGRWHWTSWDQRSTEEIEGSVLRSLLASGSGTSEVGAGAAASASVPGPLPASWIGELAPGRIVVHLPDGPIELTAADLDAVEAGDQDTAGPETVPVRATPAGRDRGWRQRLARRSRSSSPDLLAPAERSPLRDPDAAKVLVD